MKKYLKFHTSRQLWESHPKVALRAALRSITAENACGYFRASGYMGAFDAAVAAEAADKEALALLALVLA